MIYHFIYFAHVCIGKCFCIAVISIDQDFWIDELHSKILSLVMSLQMNMESWLQLAVFSRGFL